MFLFLSRFVVFLVVLFIFPALLHLGFWSLKDQPGGWRQANWSSAGILPAPKDEKEAKVYVFSARTGGVKGAFATHSWLVLKKAGGQRYDRYDVVGWGKPVRKNAYDADGRWYSNTPVIDAEISGKQAEKLIPEIERAISLYKWKNRGDYTLWPGPNSNTFVATIIRTVPNFHAATASTAVGRDFPSDGKWFSISKAGQIRLSAGGYLGAVIGRNGGFELNFLGLVAGIDPFNRAIKIPAFGTFSF